MSKPLDASRMMLQFLAGALFTASGKRSYTHTHIQKNIDVEMKATSFSCASLARALNAGKGLTRPALL